MEDEVGIYDSTGLNCFAGYFVDALLSGPTVERSPEHFPVNNESNTVALKMNYTVGSMQMDGLLKFDLVQKDIDRSMMKFLKAAYSSDFVKQKNLARKTIKPSDSFSFKPSVKPEYTTELTTPVEPVVEQVVEEEVVKAKKRKVGGVNIFPGKKVNLFFLFICRFFPYVVCAINDNIYDDFQFLVYALNLKCVSDLLIV
jgi:hypothetical protein